MAISDIQSKRMTATGSLGVGPARIRQIQVLTSTGGPGRLTLKNGSDSAASLDLDFLAGDSHSVNIPDNGVRFPNGVTITAATNITAMTFFYS
jgi:hypothetical protein